MNVIAKPPFKKVNFLPRDIEVERRADGVVILRSRHKLAPYERHIPAYLARWAKERPDQVWLAQRRGPKREWFKVTYDETKRQVDALTQALLNRGLDQTRPVMILSGNSIEHALLVMAAMQAQVPAAPVSQAYSLMSQDHKKLKYVFDLLDPGMVMVQNGPPFERALKALDLSRCEVVYVDAPPEGIKATPYADLLATNPGPEVERSIAGIGPKTIGKFLFTSGSTGMPKAVINTQEMMCANVIMGKQVRPRTPEDPIPLVLDWLPWNHTMGGNASFHGLLADGGTCYIDDGKPIPGMFDETLRNLREVSPTYYSNVPAGYAALAAALEKDEALCQSFFKQLGSLAYGGATLPDDLYERMQKLAVKYTGHRLLFGTGWGSTETAPTATATYWETERVGLIGLPFPGVELKMIPAGPKYELRLRGVIVTPGYYKRPDLTEQMFDEEGFYKIGDAGDFVDPSDPAQGLIFKGRVVEDFKLMSGTFVHVGSLRVAVIAAATPVVQDAIIAGQDKDYVAIMAWPNLLACRQIVGDDKMPVEELVKQPKVIEILRQGLRQHNSDNPGSSFQIKRALFLTEPASIDGNELTDKGYINQRATLERRAALVDALYAENPGPEVIVV